MFNNDSHIKELIKDPKTVLVFDIDGTMAVYEYGRYNHNVCSEYNWKNFKNIDKLYDKAKPIKPVQEFIQNHRPINHIYVCSQDLESSHEAKRNFIRNNYPAIHSDNICFVNKKEDKLLYLKLLKLKYYPDLDDRYFVMIDDNPDILTYIQDNSQFSTMHISSFFV